ncbi:hypothetical protein [Glycomyces tritici]|uniref:Uncharacterized protein n=1 Tax=Glycomyces tritici TaxID=2665176 RepID=A0ABT7YUE5_9ACTN|nr:hypothetical protein [Glycomyces tritici]MDN3241449.1 hypothetical protein [Glycomyces tritici]MDN3242236.1 hypothetical protein [Glycomyces tritici]
MTSLNRRQFTRSLLAVPAAALVGTGLGALSPAAASAAPADWNAQFLALQLNGELMHQTRAGDGSWQPRWTEVADGTGTIAFVAAAGIGKDLHVVVSMDRDAGRNPRHCFRNGADGSWTAFSEIPMEGGPMGTTSLAMTALNRQLHLIATNNGTVHHAVRNGDGSWQSSWTPIRVFESVSDFAITRVGTTLHVAVLSEGKLFHSIRAADGTWSSWGAVKRAAGDIGDIGAVALAGVGAALHLFAVDGSGLLQHAVRREDGSWRPFKRVAVFTEANGTLFNLTAANVGGVVQFAGVHLGDRSIKHAIRSADGSWSPVGTVRPTGLTEWPQYGLVLAPTAL